MKLRVCVALLCTLSGCMKMIRASGDLLRSNAKSEKTQRPIQTSAYPKPAQRELKAAHPRVIVNDERLADVKKLIEDDATPREWAKKIRQRTDQMLTVGPLKFGARPPVESAREVLKRLTHLGAMYRITGESKYADRARDEMLAVAKYSTWWADETFLATSEMTTAMAIGFDWVFAAISDAERGAIAKAIVEKGLSPGLRDYEKNAFWTEADHNWNIVCNSGMFMGALAVYDSDTKIARDIMTRSASSIQNGLRSFAPDGGWEEGPTYWNYATRYLAFYVASLRSAYGDDFGLAKNRGLSRTGEFRIQCIGPTGKNFNFADSQEAPGDSPQMFGMAYVFGRPEYAAFEISRTGDDPGVFDLLWYNDPPSPGIHAQGKDRGLKPAASPEIPTSESFRHVELAAMRGSWTDANTTYVAVKGGSSKAHHGHLDLGTFVLDALGQRWACDLGPDDYGLPDYNGAKRWSYYRCSTPGHNTLTFDGENQSLNGSANISRFFTSKTRSHVVLEMSEAYNDIESAKRGVALLNGRDVLVQDEFKLERRSDVVWTMHTQAKVDVDGKFATLRLGDAVLYARIVSPAEGEFEVEDVKLAKPQAAAENVRKLMIRFPKAKSGRIAVMFSPAKNAPPLAVEPLTRWSS